MEGIEEPIRVFSGNARAGAAGFPANVNVAAALSLAGIGPDRTMMEIWADPTIDRNCHVIEVESDSARFAVKNREHPLGESENGTDHRAFGPGGASQAVRSPAGRHLI